MTELSFPGRNHFAAEMTTHELHAVTDSQHRDAKLEQLFSNSRCAIFVHRLRSAGKDDPGRLEGTDRRKLHVKRMQFAVDMRLPHPSGNKLGVLGAEIKNQYFFSMDVSH